MQNGADLFCGNAWKPLKKLLDTCATLQILEQGANRNAGSFENPSAAYLFG